MSQNKSVEEIAREALRKFDWTDDLSNRNVDIIARALTSYGNQIEAHNFEVMRVLHKALGMIDGFDQSDDYLRAHGLFEKLDRTEMKWDEYHAVIASAREILASKRAEPAAILAKIEPEE